MATVDRVCGKVRAAIQKYNMIDDGDCIAVGVSGGKDSLVLLYTLALLREYYPEKFTLKAITADPCMNGEESDFSGVSALCESLGVEYIIKRTSLGKIIFEDRKEKNPCSMCARMRRGILHKTAKENGCNKIALGHHADDAIETFLMNLLEGGKLGCFSPKSYLSQRDLWLIRPLLFCQESETKALTESICLPVVKSNCPVDGNTHRQKTADLVELLKKDYPDIKAKIIGAMERAELDGFKP